MVLIAAASATEEPETPAISIPVSTTTWARPPVICPTRFLKNLIILSVMPVEFIREPAIMKRGMAIKDIESTAV